MTIEALWAISFASPFGMAGSGVVVFETGRIFGGDSMYYYIGDYTINGQNVTGSVEVIHYSGQPLNIFGPIQRMTLNYQGQFTGGNQMQAIGLDPNNPQRRVTMQFQRLANLP